MTVHCEDCRLHFCALCTRRVTHSMDPHEHVRRCVLGGCRCSHDVRTRQPDSNPRPPNIYFRLEELAKIYRDVHAARTAVALHDDIHDRCNDPKPPPSQG